MLGADRSRPRRGFAATPPSPGTLPRSTRDAAAPGSGSPTSIDSPTPSNSSGGSRSQCQRPELFSDPPRNRLPSGCDATIGTSPSTGGRALSSDATGTPRNHCVSAECAPTTGTSPPTDRHTLASDAIGAFSPDPPPEPAPITAVDATPPPAAPILDSWTRPPLDAFSPDAPRDHCASAECDTTTATSPPTNRRTLPSDAAGTLLPDAPPVPAPTTGADALPPRAALTLDSWTPPPPDAISPDAPRDNCASAGCDAATGASTPTDRRTPTSGAIGTVLPGTPPEPAPATAADGIPLCAVAILDSRMWPPLDTVSPDPTACLAATDAGDVAPAPDDRARPPEGTPRLAPTRTVSAPSRRRIRSRSSCRRMPATVRSRTHRTVRCDQAFR